MAHGIYDIVGEVECGPDSGQECQESDQME